MIYFILVINDENFIRILLGDRNYYGYIIPETSLHFTGRRSRLQIDMQLQLRYAHPAMKSHGTNFL